MTTEYKYGDKAEVWYVDVLGKSFGQSPAINRGGPPDDNRVWYVENYGVSAWENINVFFTREHALAALNKQFNDIVSSLSQWKRQVENER